MHVRALDKPAGQPCVHQGPGGCGNYEHRPEVCRVWYCMWVRDSGAIFTDEQRPDRMGLFFTATNPDPLTGRQTINAHETRHEASRSVVGRAIIAYLSRFTKVQVVPYREPTTPLTLRGASVA